MSNEMNYKIGDQVIHCFYGLGEIVDIEEKILQEVPTNCYVVRTADLKIWVPVNGNHNSTLRTPTSREDFNIIFEILSGPNEELVEDRLLRKNMLLERMRDGQLASICRVIRDLTYYKRVKKLNDQEKSILERAQKSLLTEWIYSLGVSHNQAQQAMENLLASG